MGTELTSEQKQLPFVVDNEDPTEKTPPKAPIEQTPSDSVQIIDDALDALNTVLDEVCIRILLD